jgi:hypothetical protein
MQADALNPTPQSLLQALDAEFRSSARRRIYKSLLRHNQIHQTRSWHKEDRSVNLLNFRLPGRIISHLFDQRWGLDPEAVSLNKLHNAGEDPGTVNKPENDLFISQMCFVIHRGANYTLGGTVKA